MSSGGALASSQDATARRSAHASAGDTEAAVQGQPLPARRAQSGAGGGGVPSDAPPQPPASASHAWAVSPWSACSSPCGGGLASRSAACGAVLPAPWAPGEWRVAAALPPPWEAPAPNASTPTADSASASSGEGAHCPPAPPLVAPCARWRCPAPGSPPPAALLSLSFCGLLSGGGGGGVVLAQHSPARAAFLATLGAELRAALAGALSARRVAGDPLRLASALLPEGAPLEVEPMGPGCRLLLTLPDPAAAMDAAPPPAPGAPTALQLAGDLCAALG